MVDLQHNLALAKCGRREMTELGRKCSLHIQKNLLILHEDIRFSRQKIDISAVFDARQVAMLALVI